MTGERPHTHTHLSTMSESAASRQSSDSWKEVLVIAIDIGTTHSGYAMSLSSDKYKIDTICENDPNADSAPGCAPRAKIPTALLLKPDGTFHSFGYKALRDYNSQLDENPEAEETWMYFDRFKMDLHCESVSDFQNATSKRYKFFSNIMRAKRPFKN